MVAAYELPIFPLTAKQMLIQHYSQHDGLLFKNFYDMELEFGTVLECTRLLYTGSICKINKFYGKLV